MSIIHAIVLGIVQGLSEFLPISSSGHLELVPWLFGWDDFSGDQVLQQAFDVALHLGTLAGAVAYFWSDLIRLATALVRPAPERMHDRRILGLLVVSAVPAAVAGVVAQPLLDAFEDDFWLIGVMLVVFGLVLLWADRLGGERPEAGWGWRDALVMGGAQALALQPGVSRSGATITAGRWLGLTRDAAARISFLMSLPVIAGAGLFAAVEAFTDGGIPSRLLAPFLAGMVASGVTGYAAVWATLRLVRTRSFAPFVVYRVIVGVGVVVVAATGLR